MTLANIEDPDKIPHYVAFHQSIHRVEIKKITREITTLLTSDLCDVYNRLSLVSQREEYMSAFKK